MSISWVQVEGLFDRSFSCYFSLNELVSIFTGVNGYGKTTIMNFIKFVFDPSNDTFDQIRDVPFKSFKCGMSNGYVIVLSKIKPKSKKSIFKSDFSISIVNSDQVKENELIYSELYENALKIAKYPEICMGYIWASQRKLLNAYSCDLNVIFSKPNDCYGLEQKNYMAEAIENIQNSLFSSSPNANKYAALAKIIDMDDDINHSLSTLSNGEKHWFLMFYSLIYKANTNTIVMIDEPENSLHIEWQERFIDEIFKTQLETDAQVMIATHSPHIVGSHYDLIVDKSII